MRGKGRKRCKSQSLEILGLLEQKATTRKKTVPKPDKELGGVSGTVTTSQQAPATLHMDNVYVPSATEAFVVRQFASRGRKLSSYVQKYPNTQHKKPNKTTTNNPNKPHKPKTSHQHNALTGEGSALPAQPYFSTTASQHIDQCSTTAELQLQSNRVEVFPDIIPRILEL